MTKIQERVGLLTTKSQVISFLQLTFPLTFFPEDEFDSQHINYMNI